MCPRSFSIAVINSGVAVVSEEVPIGEHSLRLNAIRRHPAHEVAVERE